MLYFGIRRKLLRKKIFLAFVKSLCFVMILIQTIQMTIDFLKFRYNYNLNVIDIKNGFDFPSITLCTERNVFFTKEKVIKYFNLRINYNFHVEKFDDIFNLKFINCNNDTLNKRNYLDKYLPKEIGCRMIIREKFYHHNKFFVRYEKMIFDEFSFDEMQSLTITANKLFICSANIHFLNQSFRSIDNCSDYFDIKEIIYSNNDFGICFTFFEKNYSIFMKEKDNLKITVNYDQASDLMAKGVLLKSFNIENHIRLTRDYQIYDIDYFRLYLLVNNGKPFRRIDAIESNRVGYHANIKFIKFIVENIQPGLIQLKFGGKTLTFIQSDIHKRFGLSGNFSRLKNRKLEVPSIKTFKLRPHGLRLGVCAGGAELRGPKKLNTFFMCHEKTE